MIGCPLSWKCILACRCGEEFTAADVPAGQAQTQMHPPRAHSQAILAAVRTRSYIANHFQMLVNHLVPILSGPTLCG